MRELKFRAWDKVQGKYIEVVRMQFSLARTPILITQELSDKQLLTDPASMYAIEQYTGLKDKNGKEIYEGDIVDFVDDGKCIGVVEYDAPEFYLNADATNWGAMYLERTQHQRVIGNIHENPELLGEE